WRRAGSLSDHAVSCGGVAVGPLPVCFCGLAEVCVHWVRRRGRLWQSEAHICRSQWPSHHHLGHSPGILSGQADTVPWEVRTENGWVFCRVSCASSIFLLCLRTIEIAAWR